MARRGSQVGLICALHQTSNSASEAWSEGGAADRSKAAASQASGISLTQVLQLLQFVLKNLCSVQGRSRWSCTRR